MDSFNAREAALFQADLARIERASLSDRKEGRTEWRSACIKDPALVQQRVEWLLDGCYGQGAYDAAWKLLGERRRNKVAIMSIWIAALEWQCSAHFARQVWSELTEPERAKLDAHVQAAMDGRRLAREEELADHIRESTEKVEPITRETV